MAKNKVKKKPTAKEMASAIIEVNTKINDVYNIVRELDNIIGLYITMKKDMKEFNSFLEKKMKEKENNDTEKNEKADRPNLQGDTDGESSGTEGVREKAE